MLRVNPSLNVADFARRYAENAFVQVPDIFDRETAERVEEVLLSLPWRMVCQNESRRNIVLTREQLAAMTSEERQQLEAGIRQRAAESFGYAYFTYPMIQAGLSGWDPGHPIHAITLFLNSPEFLSLAREITACADIIKVDAQASNYRPGHFLTRHVDEGAKKERRAAYTLGFTRKWEPDWGGLLSFIDEKKDVSRAYLPRFNTLTVFDGLRLHSVSAISAFAPAPRLSVVGWFRDDGPPFFSAGAR